MLEVTSRGEGNSFWASLKTAFTGSRKLFFILGTMLVLVLLFWYFNPLLVTVTGTGEVSAVPERAKISYLVSAMAVDPNDAISQVNTKQNQLKTALMNNFGVAESAITDSQPSVVPPSILNQGNSYGATVVSEFEMDNYSSLPSLISFLYSNGVGYVSQPVLLVKDTKSLEDEAYQLAIKDATDKAGVIGRRHWRFLRRRVSVSVATSSPQSVTTTKETIAEGEQGQQPMAFDTFKLTSLVTVVYKMW